MKATTENTRRPGAEFLRERFPAMRPLWELRANGRTDGHVNPFTVTAYQVNGAVVLLQQFEAHGWDAYVQASVSGKIPDTLDAIDTATKRRGDYVNPASEPDHLLAAAPVLFRALEKLEFWASLSRQQQDDLEDRASEATAGNVGHLECLLDEARAALAKAVA